VEGLRVATVATVDATPWFDVIDRYQNTWPARLCNSAHTTGVIRMDVMMYVAVNPPNLIQH
jgi:hypothetical protein